MALSSIDFSSSAPISPRSRRARASRRYGGRSRLPTWSARKGGVVRSIRFHYGSTSEKVIHQFGAGAMRRDIMAAVMKIDLFNHFFPKRFLEEFIDGGYAGKDIGKRVRNVPTIGDLDARFRVMDEFEDYCQFLSLPAP